MFVYVSEIRFNKYNLKNISIPKTKECTIISSCSKSKQEINLFRYANFFLN